MQQRLSELETTVSQAENAKLDAIDKIQSEAAKASQQAEVKRKALQEEFFLTHQDFFQ